MLKKPSVKSYSKQFIDNRRQAVPDHQMQYPKAKMTVSVNTMKSEQSESRVAALQQQWVCRYLQNTPATGHRRIKMLLATLNLIHWRINSKWKVPSELVKFVGFIGYQWSAVLQHIEQQRHTHSTVLQQSVQQIKHEPSHRAYLHNLMYYNVITNENQINDSVYMRTINSS